MKKRKRLASWLLVLMLVWNIFLPVSNVRAEEAGTSDVIEITTDGDKASPSDADKVSDPAEEEGENVSIATPSEGIKDPAVAPPLSLFVLPPELLSTPKDVTDILKDFLTLNITQGGNPVTEIVSGSEFQISGDLKVPTQGDYPTPANYVSQGDYAEFALDANIQTISPALGTFDLTFNNEKVGTLKFQSGKIRIDFDGPALEDIGTANVDCTFGATMKYTGTDVSEENPTKNVAIMSKTFTVKAPEIPVTQTQVKSFAMSADGTQIIWTVKVNAKKGSTDVSLKDYVFQDNLKNVGAYVNNFKIGGNTPTPSANYDINTGMLSYTFGEVTGEQTITFTTDVPPDTLVKGGDITNIAKFGKSINELQNTNSAEALFTQKTLINKIGTPGGGLSGGTYDPTNRTITWTITVNQDKIPLTNPVVFDDLNADRGTTDPINLIWDSAKWEWVNPADTDAGITLPTITGEPSDNKYTISGTITKAVKLTIVSKVPAQSVVGTTTNYNNTAKLTWDGMPAGTWSKTTENIGIGIDGLTKTATGTPDYVNRQVEWAGKVDLKNQSGFDTTNKEINVYDLLIYGKSGSVTLSATNLFTLVGSAEYTKLTPKYGQAVVANSFTGTGLTYTIEPVTVSGTRVGDLLVVKGFTADKAYNFTFKTQVLDPNIFASNGTKAVDNYASLYYDGKHLDDGNASHSYVSNILSKQVYKAGENTVGTAENSFNSADKTAVFRLNINADGYNLTGAKTEKGTLGNVKVTDTLPNANWTFIDISSGKTYELYDAATNTQITDPSAISAILESNSVSDQTAQFVFKKLDQAYYILVKAQLSETGYLAYLQDAYANGHSDSYQNATNTVEITAYSDTSWNPSTTGTVQVPTSFLVKTVDTGKNPLEWTIKFNPYDLQTFKNIKITDSIPVGLELPINQNGSLDLTAFKVTEYDNVNGAFPSTGGDDLTTQQLQEMITYDKASRILTFTPADGKLYKIVYQTEVTGNVSGSLQNTVAISGSDIDSTHTNSSYTVEDSHANSTFDRNGYLDIKKVDPQNGPVTGAEFTLYSDKALQNPIRTSSVLSDGTLRIIPIPAPKNPTDPVFTYYLKETTVPAGYESDNMVYTVTVGKGTNNKAITTVSGKEPNAVLTVKNYPTSSVGNLTISKTVDGNAGDTGKTFNFTITFTGSNIDNTYNYIGSGSQENGQITITGNKGTFQLKHHDSITITGLPKDSTYTISEEDSGEGYLTSSMGEHGTIAAGVTQTASFTNTKLLPGSLAIKKTVTGNAMENTAFDFTVTFTKPEGGVDNAQYDYSGPNGAGKIKSGEKFSLADSQVFIVTGLPKGTVYTITEDDYSGNGYTASPDQATGTIDTNKEQTVSFINTKWLPGSLTIKKTVAGNADENMKFDFTVTFAKPDGMPDNGNYDYSGTGGNGKISSSGHISLAHGESITITGLPKDTTYEVTENNASQNGYTMSADHASGTIVTNEEQTASFTNTKWLPGSLTISKTVTGSGSDTKKKFDFTVTFTADGSYSYIGNGVDSGTIKSGDTISLADGESITITVLPNGTKYQVAEADYTAQRYTTTSTGNAGTIDTLVTSTAAFTNAYHKRSSGGGGGGGNSSPGNPTHPTQPTAPTPTEPATPTPKPREEMTPQEIYNVYGEVPRGYIVGPDNSIHTPQEIYDIWGQVPLGYMVGIDGQLVPLGLPKTGDGMPANMAVYAMFVFSVLLGIFSSVIILREDEETGK